MSNTLGIFPLSKQPYSIQFLVSMTILVGIALASVFIIFIIAKLTLDLDLYSAINGEKDISPGIVSALKAIQAFQHIAVFLLPSIVISWLMTFNISDYFGLARIPSPFILIILVLISMSVIPLTSQAGYWNASLRLPGCLSWLEDWMQKKEENAAFLTGLFISSENISTLLVNIVVLAIIPAFGEEMLFRGVIQKILGGWMKSGTGAVWITAALFSLVHFQFYGFLPRLILGLVFGYLFLWSSTLWLPVLAHFLNNLIPVVSSYIYGWENIKGPIAEKGHTNMPGLIIALIITVILMLTVRRWYSEKNIKGV